MVFGLKRMTPEEEEFLKHEQRRVEMRQKVIAEKRAEIAAAERRKDIRALAQGRTRAGTTTTSSRFLSAAKSVAKGVGRGLLAVDKAIAQKGKEFKVAQSGKSTATSTTSLSRRATPARARSSGVTVIVGGQPQITTTPQERDMPLEQPRISRGGPFGSLYDTAPQQTSRKQKRDTGPFGSLYS